MESDQDLRQDLRAADRAAAAPYVDYPPTPWWYPPFMGLYFGVLVLLWSVRGVDGAMRFLVLAAMVALVAALSAFFGSYRKRRGTWPTGRPPREVNRVMWAYLVGAILILVATLALLVVAPGWLLAAGVAVVVTVGTAFYERAYARAAARARERLG